MGRGRGVHMGTRAQAFSAKIKSLRELQHKVDMSQSKEVSPLTSQVSSGVVPVPTGTDLSNSYRWFSTCLLTILRDVPSLTYSMIRSTQCSATSTELMSRSRELDSERLGLYPNLDYKELYDTLYEFIPDLRIVNSSYYSCGT